MKKSLNVQSTIEGIRLSVTEEKLGSKVNTLLGLFGRGNLQLRMLLGAIVTVEQSFDLYEVEVIVEIDRADAAGIKRVGQWIDKRTPAQQALIAYAKSHAA